VKQEAILEAHSIAFVNEYEEEGFSKIF